MSPSKYDLSPIEDNFLLFRVTFDPIRLGGALDLLSRVTSAIMATLDFGVVFRLCTFLRAGRHS